MSLKDRIIKYIQTHRGCNKTSVKNAIKERAEATIDKDIKELIEEKKVICIIDEVNPRIHHLYPNDVELSRRKTNSFILSKVEEQLKNQIVQPLS